MKALSRIFAIFLVLLLNFPVSVEFAHIFAGHEHHYCNHYADSHFHQNNQECSLFHFHHNAFSSPEFLSFEPVSPLLHQEENETTYYFLSTRFSFHFLLRGPPANSLPA